MADITQHPNYPAHRLLHHLWSKAVGTTDYDKAQWSELEAALLRTQPFNRDELHEIADNAMRLLRDLGFHNQNPDHPIWKRWQDFKAGGRA